MKKHRMEFAIASVFMIFIVLLLWENIYAINKLLPVLLVVFSVVFLLLTLLPFPSKKGVQQHEVYFPKYFTQSAILSLVSIAVVVMASVVLNKPRFSTTLDFTTNKINSLSQQSLQFLDSLSKDVQIICVPSPSPVDNYCESSLDLINLYAKSSSHIINLRVLNLANKTLMQKIQPSGFSRLVLITDANKSEVEGQITENKLTNALVNLIKFKKVVYFLTGFGEPSLNAGGSERTYADVVNSLQSKAYEVKEWSVQKGNLPADARVLVAGDNNLTYTKEVESILEAFMEKGGKLLLIVNPYREQGLSQLYSKIDLKLENVLLTLNEQTSLGQQIAKQNLNRPPVLVTNFSMTSPITRVIAQIYGSQAILPVDGARPISILPSSQKDKLKPTVLMSSYSALPIYLTPEQRNKIDLSAPFKLTPEKNSSSTPWNLGVDIVSDKTEVVVFGFSLVNAYSKSVPISEQLIPLTVAHLYNDKELISIPSRDFAPKQFKLSRNPGGWLLFFSGILPLITAIAGVVIWLKRRTA